MPDAQTIEKMLAFAAAHEEIDPQVLRDALELAHLHHRVDRAVENHLSTHGLNPRQAVIMEYLFHNPEGQVTPARLADEVSLTRSAITSALDALEKSGYLVRGQHPEDRRSVVVTLTPEGRRRIQGYLPVRYARMNQVVGSLDASERKVMITVYHKLLDVLGEILGEGQE